MSPPSQCGKNGISLCSSMSVLVTFVDFSQRFPQRMENVNYENHEKIMGIIQKLFCDQSWNCAQFTPKLLGYVLPKHVQLPLNFRSTVTLEFCLYQQN